MAEEEKRKRKRNRNREKIIDNYFSDSKFDSICYQTTRSCLINKKKRFDFFLLFFFLFLFLKPKREMKDNWVRGQTAGRNIMKEIFDMF